MNIFEMAQKAGWNDGGDCINIEKFAELVAAQEREACAKVCDSFYESWINSRGRYEFMGEGAYELAAAIRARQTT